LLAASGLSAVAGDIVELIAGDLIPADARLLESRDLFVKQIFYRFIAER
jgi:magnesium-transporting ATPase (P-type)